MSRYSVLTVRGPKPYAVIDTRRNKFVEDEDGALIQFETAQAAADLAVRVFNGDRIAGVAR